MKRIAMITAVTGILLSTAIVHAQETTIEYRCDHDSLSIPQALVRLAWARRCALSLVLPSSEFATPVPFVGSYPEYAEDPGASRHFAGSTAGVYDTNGNYRPYSINKSYMDARYTYGIPGGYTPVAINGATYDIWTANPSDSERPRPRYPTFGTTSNLSTSAPLWPSSDPDDCNLYNASGQVASVHFVAGYCTSSCYTPEQKVLFAIDQGAGPATSDDVGSGMLRGGRYEQIIDAYDRLIPRVMTLTPDSTLENFSLQPTEVYSYTTEIFDSEHKIFEIKTASGGSLRLTAEHPVLKSDGRIVFAKDLRVTDQLIKLDGSLDPVVSIGGSIHHGKVYNLRPNSPGLLENVLVAQGFLVGSSQYQNDYVTYINRVIMSHGVPTAVLPAEPAR